MVEDKANNESSAEQKQLRYYSVFTYIALCIIIPTSAAVVVNILKNHVLQKSSDTSDDLALLPVLIIWWTINIIIYFSSIFIYIATKKGKIAPSVHQLLFNMGIAALAIASLVMTGMSLYVISS